MTNMGRKLGPPKDLTTIAILVESRFLLEALMRETKQRNTGDTIQMLIEFYIAHQSEGFQKNIEEQMRIMKVTSPRVGFKYRAHRRPGEIDLSVTEPEIPTDGILIEGTDAFGNEVKVTGEGLKPLVQKPVKAIPEPIKVSKHDLLKSKPMVPAQPVQPAPMPELCYNCPAHDGYPDCDDCIGCDINPSKRLKKGGGIKIVDVEDGSPF